MALAFSNIAWSRHDDPAVLSLLRRYGVDGIEIAPTKVWPDWQGASIAAAAAYAAHLRDAGFAVAALQAIMFGKPELQLFGGGQALADHIAFTADLAAAFGAKVMVFGAPKQRDRGALSEAEAFERAIPVLQQLGSLCAMRGVTLGLEPNPVAYGCNFITHAADGLRLVRAVAAPGIGLHLDAAGMHLAGDDGPALIRQAGDVLCHFHASEPNLGAFDAPQSGHESLAQALAGTGYRGWISVEMRAAQDELAAIETACRTVSAAYSPLLTSTQKAAHG